MDAMTHATVAGATIAVAHAVKPMVETGARLAEKLLGKPCRVAGALLADQIYYWQTINRLRMFSRAGEIMRDKGIAPRVIPPGFLLPLADAAGNVDDPDVAELFARLLAEAVADDAKQHPAYVRILQQIAAPEAKLLKWLADNASLWGVVELRPDDEEFVALHLVAGAPCERGREIVLVESLKRLGVVETRQFRRHIPSYADKGLKEVVNGIGRGPGFVQGGRTEQTNLDAFAAIPTSFGREFIAACVGKRPPAPDERITGR